MKQSVHFRFSPDLLDKLRAYAESTGLTLTAAVESLCATGLNTVAQDYLGARVSALEAQVKLLQDMYTGVATNVSSVTLPPSPEPVATDVATTPPSSPAKSVPQKVSTNRSTPKRTKAKGRSPGFAG